MASPCGCRSVRAPAARRAVRRRVGTGWVTKAAVDGGILIVDVGTTAVKSAVVEKSGAVHGLSSAGGYANTGTGPLEEQDPCEWWAATCEAVQSTLDTYGENNIAGVSLSGQMQDVVLMRARETQIGGGGANAGPHPRRLCGNVFVDENAILYSDARARDEALAIESAGYGRELLNHKGATSCLAKLAWLKRNEPEALDAADTIALGAHAFIGCALCAGPVAEDLRRVNMLDMTTASTTGCLRKGATLSKDVEYHEEAFRDAGLSSVLPKLPTLSTNYGQVIGKVSVADIDAGPFAPLQGFPVFLGSGDTATLTVGCLGLSPSTSTAYGRSYMYVGTSGWIATTSRRRRGMGVVEEEEEGVFQLLHPMAVDAEGECERKKTEVANIVASSMMTAGGCAAWAVNALGYSSLRELDDDAQLANHDPTLLFLPHLAGERSPFTDSAARGAWVGLGTGTGRGDLARSVLEGVAYNYRALRQKLQRRIDPNVDMIVAGGGARSAIWLQILADVLQTRLVAVSSDGAAARGIAAHAFVGLEAWESAREADAFFEFENGDASTMYEPSLAHRSHYEQRFAVFKRLHGSLKSSGLYEC